jgi:N-acetylglucosamine malate deacetylase 1
MNLRGTRRRLRTGYSGRHKLIMPVDLLVFGPHPDDIEIGLGGTIARHVALGLTVGLCDLTAGEMGSNGTVDERLAESEAARQVLGAVWRENLRWTDRQIGKDAAQLEQAVALIRRHRPRVIAAPYWTDRHPDHGAASQLLTEAAFNSGLRRYRSEGEAWKPEWICYYFINDAAAPSFVVDVSDCYQRKREALDCHASQFQLPASGGAATRLNTPLFRQLVESRDAQFGALAGVPWAEGVVVRELLVRPSLMRVDR